MPENVEALPQLEDELALEEKMVDRGITRYYAATEAQVDKGHGHTTSYGSSLLPYAFIPVKEAIESYMAVPVSGIGAKYKALVRSVSAEQATLFTLRAVLDALMQEKSIQSVCMQIGTDIEAEQRFAYFSKLYPDIVAYKLREWEKGYVRDMARKRLSMGGTMRSLGVKWNPWSSTEKARVGLALVQCMNRVTDFVDIHPVRMGKKTYTVITPSKDTIKWLTEHTYEHSLLTPVFQPTIVPPKDWTERTSGGYHSERLATSVPLLKLRQAPQAEKIDLMNGSMQNVYQAINTLQNTAWNINRYVLNVAQTVWKNNLNAAMPKTETVPIPECPDFGPKEYWTDEVKELFQEWKRSATDAYTADKSRIGQCLNVASVLKLAYDYKDRKQFFFPYQTDFRGRIYTVPTGLSPQGPDLGKALLSFSCGMEIATEEAAEWFCIHGANCYGFDKLPYSERISKILELKHEIMEVAQDPVGNREVWTNADDPWKFLAWCDEFYRWQCEGSKFKSCIPIALDGTCNGLQHFSALLRDPVGALACNLQYSVAPSDIYRVVADKVLKVLHEDSNPLARKFLKLNINRKWTKKPVMTVPYGSTRQSCTNNCLAMIQEQGRHVFERKEEFEAALYLSGIIWSCIGDTVSAAREAMAWLRKVATLCCNQNKAMEWIAPSGFPVWHQEPKKEIVRVRTTLDRDYDIYLTTDKDEADKVRTVNGSAPNFVHSLDASHLVMSVNSASRAGIRDFACVHDSYGTHAANTARLQQRILEEFHSMYTRHSPLLAMARYLHEEKGVLNIPEPPAIKGFDINQVLDAKYLFS